MSNTMDADSSLDPRVERTRRRVLAAATDIVIEEGLSAFTIESVVQRTGIAKTTLYRQWPGRIELLADVFASLEHARPIPDTGSTREDLLRFFSQRAAASRATQWERAVPALVGAAAQYPELANTIAGLTAAVLEQIQVILRRGCERGELRDDIDTSVVATTLIGPIVFRRLLLHESPTRAIVEANIDVILTGSVLYQPSRDSAD